MILPSDDGRKKVFPCYLSENKKDTGTFKSKHLNKTHKINKKYNCNSKIAFLLQNIGYMVNNILGVQK